jgi:hypothetical protein
MPIHAWKLPLVATLLTACAGGAPDRRHLRRILRITP